MTERDALDGDKLFMVKNPSSDNGTRIVYSQKALLERGLENLAAMTDQKQRSTADTEPSDRS